MAYGACSNPNPSWNQPIIWWRGTLQYPIYNQLIDQLAALLRPVGVWVVDTRPNWLPNSGFLTLDTGPYESDSMKGIGGRVPTISTMDRIKAWSIDEPRWGMVQLPNAFTAAHEVFAHLLCGNHRPQPGYINTGPVTGAEGPMVSGPNIHPDDLARSRTFWWNWLDFYYGPNGRKLVWGTPLGRDGWTVNLNPTHPFKEGDGMGALGEDMCSDLTP